MCSLTAWDDGTFTLAISALKGFLGHMNPSKPIGFLSAEQLELVELE